MSPFGRDELARALTAGELVQLYQAQVDMRTGRVVGAEALLRWRHPTRGLLHAVPFVNDVPPAGLALDYMRWIVGTAAEQLGRWRRSSHDIPRVSVNAWPSTLDRELADDALAAASRAGIEPGAIEIECPPEAAFDPPTLAALAEMRERGLRVALDDFGDGDLRYAWLRDAPFDVVKVPMTFVLHPSPFDDAVVSAAVGFARAIGARTVAEGVETTALRDRVRAAGCDIGQGYLWARIVSGDELPAAVRAIGVDGASAATP